MAANYSHTTRSDGQILTAAIYNADHVNHITNGTPAGLDDYSVNVAQMQETADPGEVASESLATSTADELKRLRFTIRELKQLLQPSGIAQWYETPSNMHRVIHRDVTQVEVVNTIIETTAWSFSVPANTLGTDRALRLTLMGDYLQNTVGTKNFQAKVKFGATTIFDTGVDIFGQNAIRFPMICEVFLSAANATGAQIAQGRLQLGVFGVTGLTFTNVQFAQHNAIAEDSTGALVLALTVEHGTADPLISFRFNTAHLELL